MTTGQGEGSKELLITLSPRTLLSVLVLFLALAFLFLIKEILAIFAAGLFLAALIDPMADYFAAKRIPRGLAVLLIYAIGSVVLISLLVLVLPTMLLEVEKFLSFIAPDYHADFGSAFRLLSLGLPEIVQTVRSSGLSSAVPQIVEITEKTFSAVVAFAVTLIFAFYFVAEKDALLKLIAFFTPYKHQEFAGQVAMKMRDRLGAWLRGQLILMLIIAGLTYVVLTALGIPFALVLALLAGLLEAVPFVGPLLAGAIAVIVALALSPLHAVAVGVGALVVQGVEGVLVPKIMQRATGLNPVITLLAVLIGGRLGGIVGAILAIPLTNAIVVFTNEVFFSSENKA